MQPASSYSPSSSASTLPRDLAERGAQRRPEIVDGRRLEVSVTDGTSVVGCRRIDRIAAAVAATAATYGRRAKQACRHNGPLSLEGQRRRRRSSRVTTSTVTVGAAYALPADLMAGDEKMQAETGFANGAKSRKEAHIAGLCACIYTYVCVWRNYV